MSNNPTTIVNRIIDYESTYKGSPFYNTVLGAAYFQDYETYAGATDTIPDGIACRGYAGCLRALYSQAL